MINLVYANGSRSLSLYCFLLVRSVLTLLTQHRAKFQPWFLDVKTVTIRHLFILEIHRQLGPAVLVRLLVYP
jgi:hypothetical protein